MATKTLFAAIALALGGFACAGAPAATGAGEAGGIAMTDRGSSVDLNAPVSEVADHTKDAFKKMGIALTDTAMRHSGEEQELVGKYGGKDVSVHIYKSTQNISHVEVVAMEATNALDKNYAQDVLNHIVDQG